MAFKQMNTFEKKQYGKKFSKSQKWSYQKGKRNGWLSCYHNMKQYNNKPQKQEFMQHSFTKEDLNNLIDDIDNVKLY